MKPQLYTKEYGQLGKAGNWRSGLPRKQHASWLSSVNWPAMNAYIYTSNTVWLERYIQEYMYMNNYIHMHPVRFRKQKVMNLKESSERAIWKYLERGNNCVILL